MEAVSSFYAVTVVESSLVPPMASSVTSEVTPESSPLIVLSLSQVRLHFNFVLKSIRLLILPNLRLIFNFVSPELMKKLYEFCGYSVDLRCQLPNGDLETLISVKSEEELANIVDEYDRISGAKIRAVLSPPRSSHKNDSSPSSSGDRSPKSPFSVTPSPPNSPSPAYGRYLQSRYCPADLVPRRYNHRSEESHCCYACRVHNKDPRLVWH